jgi:hypothetical protein
VSARAVTWRATARFGHAEVFALVGAASFLVARFLPVLSVPYTCPLRGWLGIPCATCGMTHAFVRLAHGDLAQALAASPAGALLAAAAWAYAAADLLRAAVGWPLPVPSPRLARAGVALGVATVLASWAWLLARGVGA